MVEGGDEHGRHAVDRRAALVLNELHGFERIEGLHHDHGRAVDRAVHGAHDQAEAVEERHLDQQPVGRAHAHDLTHHGGVADDVQVGQHDALGKAGGARGVLHVHDVVKAELGLALEQVFAADATGQLEHLGILEHAGGLCAAADVNHVFEPGQLGRFELARIALVQLGHDLAHHVVIAGVAPALAQKQGGRIRLTDDVLELARLEVGVDRDENRADHAQRELQMHPFGNIGGPDRDMVAALDA
ncbi:MAG: hypothetical protein BWY87_00247 [Deltaproteobacteria bacterium ADurb.Bin510]|nr:MAG: hypothetical protein BWY87_00247 [Deltaproteobacteria bacterium ADurb.Bin510]